MQIVYLNYNLITYCMIVIPFLIYKALHNLAFLIILNVTTAYLTLHELQIQISSLHEDGIWRKR